FNHELNSRWFIIPGLTVVICGLIGILLTALTVAREWENGSMEMLLSTPARPAAIIAGKLAPYLLLGFCGVVFVYGAARLVFGVPFCGSHALYALSCVLFLLAATAQGLFISIATRQQQLAMQFSIVSGLLPSLLLSGFVFPIESMPLFFRYFTFILPPRWFMEISRGIFLKGATLADLWPQLLMQAALCAILIKLALKKFKTDLEP
ncbi:MAG TPA: ABC transporter permease subunit, partial [Elusimicrobiales bacterium]|nr:ABC transporter permease subunit [Elusimicrobiales bacterium]